MFRKTTKRKKTPSTPEQSKTTQDIPKTHKKPKSQEDEYAEFEKAFVERKKALAASTTTEVVEDATVATAKVRPPQSKKREHTEAEKLNREVKKKSYSTVKVSRWNIERLKKLGRKGESYDQIIGLLLDKKPKRWRSFTD